MQATGLAPSRFRLVPFQVRLPRSSLRTIPGRSSGHWQGHAHRIRGENFCNALVFVPAGDGSTDHLDEDVPTPKEIHLNDGQYELGREEPAQIVIPYPTVSSRHAMLRVDGEEVSVTDLNSTNGTYINDNELVPMEAETMTIGQNVTFGDMYLAKYSLEKRS